MGVGQRGLRQLEQQTGMTESDTRELGGGGDSGLAVFSVGGLFYLRVMNNYIIEGYFISQNRNPRKSQESPGKISKLSTGFSRSRNF
jgi:hypothetical protein